MHVPEHDLARHAELARQIEAHNAAYHGNDNPTISDAEFDALTREMRNLEALYPELRTEGRVGYDPSTSTFEKVTHPSRMHSLDNAFGDEDMSAFYRSVSEALHTPAFGFTCEPKIDGLSINLIYTNGQLTHALTRGDGTTGEDVTANVLSIPGIPRTVPVGGRLEVRGEIYMPRAAFEAYNTHAEEFGIKPLKNPRNGAAGAIRQKHAAGSGARGLQAVFYGMGVRDEVNVSTQKQLLQWLAEHGFPTSSENRTVRSIEEALAYHHDLTARRAQLPMDADGTVIKLNSLALRDEVGYTSRAPKWAIAYKFPTEVGETTVEDIIVQTGRTGKLTPVAVLTPILLEGTTVTRATLHNEDHIKELDLRVGDRVAIHKSGGIIPQIQRVVDAERPGRGPAYTFPTHCPECQQKAEREEGKAGTFCVNPHCGARVFERIRRFAERDVMDIRGLGEGVIEALIDKGLIHDPADLYLLTEDQVANLMLRGEDGKERRYGASNAKKLIMEIEKSKSPPMSRMVKALGFPNVGRGTGERVARYHADLDSLMRATQQELEQIEDVGPIVAASLHGGLRDERTQDFIRRLHARGVRERSEISVTGDGLKGLSFVITGTLSVGRDEMSSFLKSHGAKVSGSVSSKTTYLLCGEGGGGKRDKAESLGVTIIEEEALQTLLQERGVTTYPQA